MDIVLIAVGFVIGVHVGRNFFGKIRKEAIDWKKFEHTLKALKQSSAKFDYSSNRFNKTKIDERAY